MKKKDLEIILQKLPPHPAPIIKLEQYPTPANIAADIIFNAYMEKDIAEKTVLDLGCGTGVFGIGAKLLGAAEVLGVDVDGTGLAIAEGYANALSLEIKFIEKDINAFDPEAVTDSPIDTIIQNPPFGAQKAAKEADRIFLEKAVSWGNVIYSMHLAKTEQFIELLIGKLGAEIIWKKDYAFTINHMFPFHTQEKKDFDVILFKIKS